MWKIHRVFGIYLRWIGTNERSQIWSYQISFRQGIPPAASMCIVRWLFHDTETIHNWRATPILTETDTPFLVDIWQKRFLKSQWGVTGMMIALNFLPTVIFCHDCGHLGVLLRTRKYKFLCLGEISIPCVLWSRYLWSFLMVWTIRLTVWDDFSMEVKGRCNWRSWRRWMKRPGKRSRWSWPDVQLGSNSMAGLAAHETGRTFWGDPEETGNFLDSKNWQ